MHVGGHLNALRKARQLTVLLIAEAEAGVIGHVVASPVSIADGAAGWYGLGPISIAPESQGLGVGSSLMREVLRVLRESTASGCVLLGHPGYYRRFGL